MKHKKHREKKGLFLIEGIRLVKEAFIHKMNVRSIIVNQDCTKACEFVKSLVPKDNIPGGLSCELIGVSEKLYRVMSDTINPQGIMATVEMRQYTPLEILGGKNLYVILESINNPGNAGTIIRTAHAAGFTGVFVLKGSVDIYNPKTIRSTMGSLFALPYCIDVELRDIVKILKASGVSVYNCSPDAETPYFDIDLSKDAAIIIGNEAEGISKEALDSSDCSISIPMPGGTESLNAAAAAAVLIYESVRRNMKN